MAIRQMTTEEYEKEYGVKPFAETAPQPKPNEGGNFLTGLAKSGLSTIKGTLQLGGKVANKVLPKSIEPGDYLSEKDIQENQPGFVKKYASEEALKTRGTGEKIGKFVGDVAQFAVPGTKVSMATKALPAVAKYGTRALTSGGIASLQTGKVGKESAIAAGTEIGVPMASGVVKAAATFTGRLLRGVASGLSGASSAQIKAILDDPIAAKKFVGEIKKVGGAEFLRKEARNIVEGVSGIRKEARTAFGKGLEELSEADIKPALFRDKVKPVLDKYGSQVTKGKRILQNVEFDDPKNVKRASELIDRFSRVKLDGKSLRKLADDIENSTYKIATSDERLSFNAFTKDLSRSLKEAVSGSTSKLDDIDRAFSGEMQLVDEIENIFGKVKFKSAKEILTVSQRLESLFSKKGLAPEAIDSFLQRIGISPGKFRAGEAVRQMGELAEGSNTIGTNPLEIVRAFTAAIVPPTAVRAIAIQTGIAEGVLREMATKLSPAARGILIRVLIGEPSPPENN